MRVVRAAEGRLIRLLDLVLHRAPAGMLGELPPAPPPQRLSASAGALIQQRLAAGCTSYLACGGWRSERYLRGEAPVAGRLWERHPTSQLGLRFSGATVQFLRRLAFGDSPAPTAPLKLTTGDRFVMLLAVDALQGTPLDVRLRSDPGVTRDALVQLAFPAWCAETAARGADFAPWLAVESVWILEALQHRLTAWWDVGTSTSSIAGSEPERTKTNRGRVLEGFLSAIESAGRQDLARFLLMARRLPDGARPALERLQAWQHAARTIGYFDEGYAAAQFWQSEWERLGGVQKLATFKVGVPASAGPRPHDVQTA